MSTVSRVLPSCLFAFLAACAHTTPAPGAEAVSLPPASICTPVEKVSVTRVPAPPQISCSDPAVRKALENGCNKDEVMNCHQMGACLLAEVMGRATDEASKPQVDAARASLGKGCDAGIAESCSLKAALRLELGEGDKATCAEVVRACQLGDETTGCASCRYARCDG